MDRREFIKACSAAGVAANLSSLSGLVWGKQSSSQPVLVNVFLRGGSDGLQWVAPADDPAYVAARPAPMRVESGGSKPGFDLKHSTGGGAGFFLNAQAGGLNELYQSQSLAFVHAVGLTDGTRSHFVAQELIEKGVARVSEGYSVRDGWLARVATQRSKGLLYSSSALGVGALGGARSVLTGTRLNEMANLPGGDATSRFLRLLPVSQSPNVAEKAVLDTLSLIDLMRPRIEGRLGKPANELEPRSPGAIYDALEAVAELMRLDVGLSVACVDHGGWDTHEGQAGRFDSLVEQFSGALSQFLSTVDRRGQKVIVLVSTEFGRRLRSNFSGGTDHGHGACWMVLGQGVNGGRVLGQWPGLSSEQLDRGVDLAVTTDYRTVYASVLTQLGYSANQVFLGPQSNGLKGLFV